MLIMLKSITWHVVLAKLLPVGVSFRLFLQNGFHASCVPSSYVSCELYLRGLYNYSLRMFNLKTWGLLSRMCWFTTLMLVDKVVRICREYIKMFLGRIKYKHVDFSWSIKDHKGSRSAVGYIFISQLLQKIGRLFLLCLLVKQTCIPLGFFSFFFTTVKNICCCSDITVSHDVNVGLPPAFFN